MPRNPEIPSPNQIIDTVPGTYGLPLLGHTVKFLKDPRGAVKEMYELYGSVCRISIFYNRAILFLGADATQVILQDREQNFSAKLAWGEMLGDLSVDSLTLKDFDEHRLHRRIIQAAFKKNAMQSYLPVMNDVISGGIEHWAKEEKFKFYPQVKELLLQVAAEVFLGLPLGEDTKKVNKAFIDVINSTIALVKYPVPGNAYWKAMKGEEFLREFSLRLVQQKRGSGGKDMFTQMCEATSENGEKFTDEEVVEHMLFMLVAAHDTNTASLTTMFYALAQHQDWQQRLREECLAIEGPLTYDDLEKLPSVDLVFKEALRLYAPLPVIPRRSLRDCKVGDVDVPANTMCWVVPDFTHLMEEYWTNPTEFDPERFAEPRNEHKNHPFAFTPFGGGAHMCLGLHFAEMQVKAIVCQLLKRYKFDLVPDYKAKYQLFPIPKPKDDLPLVVTPIQ